MFSCKRCGYSTDIKGNLKNHFRRKRPCKPLLNDIPIKVLIDAFLIENTHKYTQPTQNYTKPTHKYTQSTHKYTQSTHKYTKKYICESCNKRFSRSDSLKRHQKKFCLEIKKNSEQEKIIKEMKKELEKIKLEKEIMSNEMDKLIDKVGDTNIQNQQINIQINNYGKENIEYINDALIKSLIDMPYKALPRLIKNIHFNPEHPENHNIKITNKKLPFIGVWKDNRWIVKNKYEILVDIVDKGFNILDDKYQESDKDIDPNKKILLEKFQDKYYENDKTLLKNLNKDVELLIINNSKMVKD